MKRKHSEDKDKVKLVVAEGVVERKEKNALTYMVQYSADLTNVNQLDSEMLFTTCPNAKRLLISTGNKFTLFRRRNGSCTKAKTWLPSAGANEKYKCILDGFIKANNIYIMDCIQWKGHSLADMPFLMRMQYFYSQLKEYTDFCNAKDQFVWYLLPYYEMKDLNTYLLNALMPLPMNSFCTAQISTIQFSRDDLDGLLFYKINSIYKFSENGLNLDMKWLPKDRIQWLASLLINSRVS